MNLENHSKKVPILVGPWGGQNGAHWDDGIYSNIRQIEVSHGATVDSIRIEYDKNGSSFWSERHGGRGSDKLDKINLSHPEEFLSSIHGHYGSFNQLGPVMVRSLTFVSNKNTYGPYGIEQGTYFSLPLAGSKIVGFHGRCGWYLDAIGVHIQPIHKPLLYSHANVQSHAMVQSQNTYAFTANEKFGYTTVQGNLGNDYDILVAFRRKDGFGDFKPMNTALQNSFPLDQTPKPQQISDTRDHLTDGQPKISVVPVPSVPSVAAKGVLTYGPWGGTGGTAFDDGIHDGIKNIKISRNLGIASIKIRYVKGSEEDWGSKNGGHGGFKKDKIEFDYPSEVLTHVTGYHGFIMGANVIRSLTFHTTKSQYGPYGEELGQQFTTKLKEGRIVGFHGRKGLFLDAIGVHVIEGKVVNPIINSLPIKQQVKVVPPVIKPSPNSTNQQPKIVPPNLKPSPNTTTLQPKTIRPILNPAANTTNQPPKIVRLVDVKKPNSSDEEHRTSLPIIPSSKQQVPANEPDKASWYNKLGNKSTDEAIQRVVKDPAPHGTGPWGGEGCKPWDDGVFTGIQQIIITRYHDVICSIEIEYDRNGQSVWSINHGGATGQMAHKIKLEYPHEVVTCISGYYGPIRKEEPLKVIKSLTFTTSRRKIGPFGEEIGTYFSSGTTEGKVVGFHGRSGMYLDAIGVHMQHWLGNQKPAKPSTLKKMFS